MRISTLHLSPFKQLAVATYREWSADRASSLAAALAFYTMLSLGPLLFVVVAVSGMFFGAEAARQGLSGQLQGLLGDGAVGAIEALMDQASTPHRGRLATAVGLATLLFGASGAFAALQEAMDAIWHVEPAPHASIWNLLRRRFVSLSMVVGVGFLLTVSLVVDALLAALQDHLNRQVPLGSAVALSVHFVGSTAILGLFFSLLFKVLPDARVRWSDVWVGGGATALLFAVGKLAIGLYLGRSGVTTPFGAAGSLVVILLWVYYAAQILFLGAEFVRQYASRYGGRVQPAPEAVAVEKRIV